MKAMILSAGLGVRLRPLTDSTPKPLIEVGGVPVIEITINKLRDAGIVDLVLNLHHLGDKISNHLGDGARLGVRIKYSNEPEILGTGGGIKKAQPLLADGSFLVVNGDIMFDLDIGALKEFHDRSGALVTMVLRQDPSAAKMGLIETDREGRVMKITGKGPGGPGLKGFMFTGIHVLGEKVFDYIPGGVHCSIIQSYIEMLNRGGKIMSYETKGRWADIGTPQGLENARALFGSKKGTL